MEAEQNHLSYSELLTMIVSDEFQVRRNRTLQRLITNARIESTKTLESFDLTFNPSINAALRSESSHSVTLLKKQRIYFL